VAMPTVCQATRLDFKAARRAGKSLLRPRRPKKSSSVSQDVLETSREFCASCRGVCTRHVPWFRQRRRTPRRTFARHRPRCEARRRRSDLPRQLADGRAPRRRPHSTARTPGDGLGRLARALPVRGVYACLGGLPGGWQDVLNAREDTSSGTDARSRLSCPRASTSPFDDHGADDGWLPLWARVA
jgi:hypothetical protein